MYKLHKATSGEMQISS